MKIMKLIVATLIIVGFSTAALAESEKFAHYGLGFGVIKPAGWTFVLSEINLVSIDKEFYNDDELNNFLDKYSKSTFFSIVKEPITSKDFTATVRARVKPYKTFNGYPAKTILITMAKFFPESYKNFKLIQNPIEVEVGGIKSAYMCFEYSIEISNNKQLKIISDLWLVPAEKYFFIIDGGTLYDDKTGQRQEIQKIIENIAIRG